MRLTFLQANSDEVGPIRRIVIMTKPERSPVVKCGIIVLLVYAISFPANIHIFLHDPNTSDGLMCGKKDEQTPGRSDASVPPPLRPKKRKRGLCPRLPRVQVMLLLGGKRIDAHAHSVELQARNLLIELGRQRIHTGL